MVWGSKVILVGKNRLYADRKGKGDSWYNEYDFSYFDWFFYY